MRSDPCENLHVVGLRPVQAVRQPQPQLRPDPSDISHNAHYVKPRNAGFARVVVTFRRRGPSSKALLEVPKHLFLQLKK